MAQTWTRQQLTNLLVAGVVLAVIQTHVFFLADSSQTTSFGCETSERVGRSEGTVRPTCKEATCIQIFGQLGYDACRPAVNLTPFPLCYSRYAVIISSHQAHDMTTHSFVGRTDLIFVVVEAGPLFAFANLRVWTIGHSSTVAVSATFLCRVPKSASFDIEFIVSKRNTSSSDTITALHNDTYILQFSYCT